MSIDLEDILLSIHNNRVPQLWHSKAYPSLLPLSEWLKDFLRRIDFFKKWINEETLPKCFWLPGLSFPQGLLTAALQKHSRQTKIPIDHLRFRFHCLSKVEYEITEAPKTGIYVSGLYMNGAQWSHQENCIVEAEWGKLFSEMPVIWFEPILDYEPNPSDYQCPLYVTSARAGITSTSGTSTNFITTLDIPAGGDSDRWIMRGCALVCQPH